MKGELSLFCDLVHHFDLNWNSWLQVLFLLMNGLIIDIVTALGYWCTKVTIRSVKLGLLGVRLRLTFSCKVRDAAISLGLKFLVQNSIDILFLWGKSFIWVNLPFRRRRRASSCASLLVDKPHFLTFIRPLFPAGYITHPSRILDLTTHGSQRAHINLCNSTVGIVL